MPVSNLRLTIHPDVLTILGKQLVSNPVIALSELVKNSYDADAEQVILEFLDSPKKQIRVVDDGHGMNLDEIESGWLAIGTPMKRLRHRSRRKKRHFVGSMGIGRLAAFSLAGTVNLTTSVGDGEEHSLDLSLNDLSTIESIVNAKIKVRTEKAQQKSGTAITLSNLTWWPSGDEEKEIRQSLSALCGPEVTKDFKIFLNIRGETRPLEPEKDLPVAPIELIASVRKTGMVSARIRATRSLYLGKGKIPVDGWHFESDGKYSNIKEVSMRALWYPIGERPRVQYWRVARRDEVKVAAGMRVYRDGVRVLPYGEPDNDWLELESTYVAKGAEERHPRPKSVLGWMFCTRQKNPDLIDTANREGLIDNAASRELKQFGQWAFQKIAEVRRELEPIVPKGMEPKIEDFDEIKSMIEKLRAALPDKKDMKVELESIEKLVDAYQSQTELTSLYRDRLASGALVNVVMHDIGVSLKPTETLVTNARRLTCDKEEHGDVLRIVEELVPRIIGAYDLLRGAGRVGAYRVSSVSVREVVDPIVDRMSLVFSANRIRIFKEYDPLVVKMRSADLWAVLVNLLTNAATSSEFTHARQRDFPSERKINLRLERNGKDLEVECEDNGPGLPDKPDGWIWVPFNSTRSGGGSGLGLYVVSDAVNWYGGTYSAEGSKLYKSGSLFRLVFPGVVLNARQ